MSADSLSGRAQLRELFCDAGVEAGTQVPDIEVTNITSNSTSVTPGSLFLACCGVAHHGLEFAAQAVQAGAAAIAWEPEAGMQAPVLPATVAGIAVPDLGAQAGSIANSFFAHPSAQLAVTGITGTNGKTTTAWLVSQALAYLNCPSAYMGTLGYGMGGELKPSALTTPGVIVVHRRLREMLDAGAKAVVMEVSSHGLDQGRVDAVNMATAAFTNLSRDHLDYHGDFAAYRAAKAKLFSRAALENAVINVGDAFGAELAQGLAKQLRLISVALAGSSNAQSAALQAELVDTHQGGLRLRFSGDYGTADLRSPLWGRFNAENLLVATGILLAHGYELAQATAALENCSAPPGRLQVIRGGSNAPLVVVDFAHTPDALAQAIEVVREHCSGAVSVVFGCGGDRDKGKRGEMGSVARRLANRIIVTDDNPRNEDPEAIVKAVLAGMSDTETVTVVRDRALAIKTAVQAAGAGDAILVAGKGSENYQLTGGQSVPFSDAECAANILESLA